MKKSIFMLVTFALICFVANAQNIESVQESDTVAVLPEDTLSTQTLEENRINKDFQLQETLSLELLLLQHSLLEEPEPVKFDYIFPGFNYYESEYLTVTPYNYSFFNRYEGGQMMGINNRLQFSDKLWANVNVAAMKSFIGVFQPTPYDNASLSLNVKWEVHDRLRLFAFGQASLREGISPALTPRVNGGYNYGGGVEVRITKNVGIGLGISNSYFRKNWIRQPYVLPVIGW